MYNMYYIEKDTRGMTLEEKLVNAYENNILCFDQSQNLISNRLIKTAEEVFKENYKEEIVYIIVPMGLNLPASEKYYWLVTDYNTAFSIKMLNTLDESINCLNRQYGMKYNTFCIFCSHTHFVLGAVQCKTS